MNTLEIRRYVLLYKIDTKEIWKNLREITRENQRLIVCCMAR